MRLEFVNKSAMDPDNEAINSERLINAYAEPVQDGRSAYQIKSVPGTEAYASVPAVIPRAVETMNGDLYAIVGGGIYSISDAGAVSTLGTVSDGAFTSMSANNGVLAIAANGTYRTWDGATLASPTVGPFSSVGGVEFLGQYTFYTEKDGRKCGWSDPADAKTMPALNVRTTESRDDNNIRPVAVNGNMMIFKERSIEVWYLVPGGSGSGAFSRLAGGVIDTGLKSFGLVAKFDGGVFFVGDDGIAYITNGQALKPVSTPAIETNIAQGSPTNCFYYEDEGHKFCVIRYSDRPASTYDISTGLWHERSSGAAFEAWEARLSVSAYGAWRICTQDGSIYRAGRYNADADEPLTRTMISRTLDAENRFRVPEIMLKARVGRGNVTGTADNNVPALTQVNLITDGSGVFVDDSAGKYLATVEDSGAREPILMVDISRDGGMTWGQTREVGIGTMGQYWKRLRTRGWGQFNQLTMRIRMSDRIDASLYSSAEVKVA